MTGEDIWKIPFIDVMMGLVMLFLVLLFMTIASENMSKAKQKDEIKSNSLYSIKVEWPGEKKDDVDTYVQDPTGAIVYFRRMSANLMVLNHDDTGQVSNTVKLNDGSVISSAFNEESVAIRGIIPGEYIVNVHMYKKRDPASTDVNVYLYKNTQDGYEAVTSRTITMSNSGDEHTAFRFTLTKDGQCGDINSTSIKFVSDANAKSASTP